MLRLGGYPCASFCHQYAQKGPRLVLWAFLIRETWDLRRLMEVVVQGLVLPSLRATAGYCSRSLAVRGFRSGALRVRSSLAPSTSASHPSGPLCFFSPQLLPFSVGACQPLPCRRQFERSLVEVKFRKASGKDTSNIPFKVLRTPSGNLPVYSRIRKHGTAVTTVIRHAMGDISALKKDLLAICEAPVRERCGTLEVKGLHVLKIKQWLTHLGF